MPKLLMALIAIAATTAELAGSGKASARIEAEANTVSDPYSMRMLLCHPVEVGDGGKW